MAKENDITKEAWAQAVKNVEKGTDAPDAGAIAGQAEKMDPAKFAAAKEQAAADAAKGEIEGLIDDISTIVKETGKPFSMQVDGKELSVMPGSDGSKDPTIMLDGEKMSAKDVSEKLAEAGRGKQSIIQEFGNQIRHSAMQYMIHLPGKGAHLVVGTAKAAVRTAAQKLMGNGKNLMQQAVGVAFR